MKILLVLRNNGHLNLVCRHNQLDPAQYIHIQDGGTFIYLFIGIRYQLVLLDNCQLFCIYIFFVSQGSNDYYTLPKTVLLIFFSTENTSHSYGAVIMGPIFVQSVCSARENVLSTVHAH